MANSTPHAESSDAETDLRTEESRGTSFRHPQRTNYHLLSERMFPDGFGGLGRTAIMQRRGDGVNIIMNESEKLSGNQPDYRVLEDAEVFLTIYAAELPNQEVVE